MDRPNGLLKVVSILYIVLSAIGIVLGALTAILGGSVLGALVESLGVGLAVGGTLAVILIAGSVYTLICGILGVKGRFGACKVLGIITLVFGILGGAATIYLSAASRPAVITSVMELILPVLYVWGAFKGPAA